MRRIVTGVCKQATKVVEVILEIVFPEKMAHVVQRVARRSSWRFNVHLAVAYRDTAFLKAYTKCRTIPERKNEYEGCSGRGWPRKSW
jgi:hypothetical protein